MGHEDFEKIEKDNKVLALIVRKKFEKTGYNFVSPLEFPLQMGINFMKKGDHVKPHAHVPFKELKEVPVQEYIYIEKGKTEVNLFHEKKKHITVVLNQGDMILLNCGHEFRFLEDTKMIEVKQGPYRGKYDEKEYF